MSGIDEGPATQGQFEQFLQNEGIVDWLRETDPGESVPETPVEADAETEAHVEQPRDEKGRFTKATEDGQSEGAEEAVDSGDPSPDAASETAEDGQSDEGDLVLEIDDDLQAVLDKYDGDIGKALKALGESQSMIGRQANEVGELRRELQELRQAMQQPQQVQQPMPPQYVGPYINKIDENPEGLVYEALERGDGRTLEAALRQWGEYEPFEATAFLINLQQQAALQQAAPAPAAPAPQPTPQQGPSVEAAMSEVVARHPDAEKYLPAMEQVAQEFPTLRDSMRSQNAAVAVGAFEEILKIAKARSQSTDTQSAMRRLVLKTQEEVRDEKAAAAVVSAKNQSAATAKTGVDQFLDLFAEATGQGLDGDWITRSNL